MIRVDITKKIKTYEGFTLLNIRTSFLSESVTQILGISGAGKTTLLKILAGLVVPDKGMISVHEKVWYDSTSDFFLEPQKRNVGFVFQDYALFPNMTLKEHLMYGTKDEPYIDQLLHIGQMEPYVNHKPRQLSGGQQQRLAILRALSTKPSILLMDEPFSALDKGLKSQLIHNLKELIVDHKITCLVVTHDPFEAGGFADQTFEL